MSILDGVKSLIKTVDRLTPGGIAGHQGLENPFSKTKSYSPLGVFDFDDDDEKKDNKR